MTDGRDPGQLRDLAVEVAAAAATLVRERRLLGVEVADTKSSDVDVVTEADRASEELVSRLLAARRPDDGFLGEEGEHRPGSTGVRWIVDPIDGTVNFLYGLPYYAVSIAAEVDGRVVAGVVQNAATGVVYAAALGAGATRATKEKLGWPLEPRFLVPADVTAHCRTTNSSTRSLRSACSNMWGAHACPSTSPSCTRCSSRGACC